jgi:hypothetical protein
MVTEAEVGAMQPPSKEYWQLVEAGRSKDQSLPWSLQKEPALLTSQLQSDKTNHGCLKCLKENTFVFLKPTQLVVICYSSKRKLIHNGSQVMANLQSSLP